jgi:hypothetical protein
VRKRIISAVKKVEFASDRMSYILLIGRWCHIIVLYIHDTTEEKNLWSEERLLRGIGTCFK